MAVKEYQTSSSGVPEQTAGILADAVAQPVLPLVGTLIVKGILDTHSSLPGVVRMEVVTIDEDVTAAGKAQELFDVRTQ